jgi:trehalose-6-phosphate synthase
VPIHYLHRNLDREELVAYYRSADIALITSLKDGMNLVAKEYCASHVEEQGVLILSEFAGAGPELREGALLVNPNDFMQVADALMKACEMTNAEKQRRMRAMRLVIKQHNVERWAASFLEALRRKSELFAAGAPKPVTAEAKNPFRLLWDTGRFLLGKKAAGLRQSGPEAFSNGRPLR